MEKILIVDDSVVNRKMLRKILEEFYEIDEAGDGEEALKILYEDGEEILAVLLDLVMPGMDGFAVLKEIRNNATLAGIPVIIQTENSDEEFEMNALRAGATDFVSKPYKREVIRTRLQNIINTRIMLNEITNLSCDEITGLMSINQFYYEGEKWMNQNPEQNFDVIAFDIMHFSVINDSKGIEGGNQILKHIADRIREMQEHIKFFASRVYADRFILLIRRQSGYLDHLIEEADKLTADYSKFMSIHIKFGIYEITEKNIKLASVCDRAFSATDLIKDYYGNRYVYYDEELHQKILAEEHINDEMENALKEEQFQVYFQPKYDLFTNTLAGAEALVRWLHPKDGVIVPGEFIPIFEKNGFIVQLDQYVWRATAREIAEWIQEGNKVVPVSVNISRIDIERIDVVKIICDIVEEYEIVPELLHLEITESAYMQDTDKIIDVVTTLQKNGFIIEMDDFGSGYSSLNMLAKLPIDVVKLDMNFIQTIENSMNAKTIIEYTIGLAKWMNLPVVAEGVETKEQLDLLKRLECNYVQGYIFAKPMPADQFETNLFSDNEEEDKKEKESGLFFHNSKKKYRMLIVEDLPLNRAIIRSYFEDVFSVVEAVNGKTALEYLNSGEKVDIIILDIFMPEMNGYEMLKELRKTPELKKIPVLAISSEASKEDRGKALSLGADAFVSKPFTAESIINRVRILLRAHNTLNEMNTWDVRDTIENPWMKEVCEEIAIIRIETGNICHIEGEKLVESDCKYEEIISSDIYQKCQSEFDPIDNRVLTVQDSGKYYNLQLVIVDAKQYCLCFKINLNENSSLNINE